MLHWISSSTISKKMLETTGKSFVKGQTPTNSIEALKKTTVKSQLCKTGETTATQQNDYCHMKLWSFHAKNGID